MQRRGDDAAILDLRTALGEDPHEGADVFNMAALCLHVAARANGVSQLHGEVSRGLFAMVPGGNAITSVTNGVHARTWVSPELQDLFDDQLGAGWDRGDEAAWSGIGDVATGWVTEFILYPWGDPRSSARMRKLVSR